MAAPAPTANPNQAQTPNAENPNQAQTPNAQSGTIPKPSAILVPIPPNKPGEPAFQLKLEPGGRLEFRSDKLSEEPCQIEVKLTNTTKERQTFKVKCTSNEIFRVRPPLGFCDPDATVSIKIIFSSKTIPMSARHYFAFYHMRNDEKDKTARQVWTPESKHEGVRRIMAYFLKNDGTPAAPTDPASLPPPAPSAAGGGQTPPAPAPH
ncbi:unnamed protein product [Thelazia callipaeda]|uniref:Major sperm protein n=1 Tax=Thelazia callipaeda TaxID=103827 RepID=A0A0N5D9C4_THECL|nr:unnamed protein product [Thelazia callipaeda]